jgi:hypothetical protein
MIIIVEDIHQLWVGPINENTTNSRYVFIMHIQLICMLITGTTLFITYNRGCFFEFCDIENLANFLQKVSIIS